MKKLIFVPFVFIASLVGAQTNQVPNELVPLSFTNVFVEAWTGYQYQGNTGANTALLGGSVSFSSFTLGGLGKVDYGLGCEMAIGAGSSIVSSVSIRAELKKNFDTTQVYVFAGGGRDYDGAQYFNDFGCGVNYNLYRGQNWSTYVGSGIDFRMDGVTKMDYLPFVHTGIAF